MVTAHCRGKMVLIRYADDFIIGCERAADAERIMKALPKRFARIGLEVNTEKSQLVKFACPQRSTGRGPDGKKPGTFSFLPGFNAGGPGVWSRNMSAWKADGEQ